MEKGVMRTTSKICFWLAPIVFGLLFSFIGVSPPQYQYAKFSCYATAILLFFGYLGWVFSSQKCTKVHVWLGLACVVAATIMPPLGEYWISNLETQYIINYLQSKNVGTLRPLGPALFTNIEKKAPNLPLEIGESGAIFDYNGPPDNPLFTLFDAPLLIERVDQKIVISTQIRDFDGSLICTLVRNEWKVASPPKTWDRNYTQNALEVINAQGRVVLQVVVKLDVIQIQGEWRGKGGGIRLVARPGKDAGADIVIIKPAFPDGPPDAQEIKKIFMYPSDLHFGELAK